MEKVRFCTSLARSKTAGSIKIHQTDYASELTTTTKLLGKVHVFFYIKMKTSSKLLPTKPYIL